MPFYASPPPYDRGLLTIHSTGHCNFPTSPFHFRRDSGWRSYQLMYTLRGEGICDIEGKAFRVRKDSVGIMPKDKGHGYRAAKGCGQWAYRWIDFGGDMAPEFLKMFGLANRHCVHGCQDAWLTIEEFVATLEGGGNLALHEAVALFLRILAIVERCSLGRGRNERSPKAHELDQAAKRFMEDHLHEPLSLKDVARSVRSSPCHLIRAFKRNNGMTPMAYLQQLRANRAKELLLQVGMNVSEAGQQVGYPVLQHFSRMFKTQTGLSPRAFLRMNAK